MTKILADCWRYRPDTHGGLESKLFAVHEAVPEDEGWCLTPGEAGFPELDKVPDAPEPAGGAEIETGIVEAPKRKRRTKAEMEAAREAEAEPDLADEAPVK